MTRLVCVLALAAAAPSIPAALIEGSATCTVNENTVSALQKCTLYIATPSSGYASAAWGYRIAPEAGGYLSFSASGGAGAEVVQRPFAVVRATAAVEFAVVVSLLTLGPQRPGWAEIRISRDADVTYIPDPACEFVMRAGPVSAGGCMPGGGYTDFFIPVTLGTPFDLSAAGRLGHSAPQQMWNALHSNVFGTAQVRFLEADRVTVVEALEIPEPQWLPAGGLATLVALALRRRQRRRTER